MILVAKALRDIRGQIVGFGVVNVVIALVDVLAFPSYSRQLADFELPPAFKALIGELAGFGTPEGFLSAEFFGWIHLLLITFAIIQGTGAIAGEEANGTLDLLLAQPISRLRVVLEKALALAIGISLIALVSLLGFGIGLLWVELNVPLWRITFAVVAMIPIALLFGTFALWMSALLPNRATAAMTVTAIAVASYFVHTLGQVVPALDPLRPLSVFNYYASPRLLLGTVPWRDLALLVALSPVCVAAAIWSFQGRDVTLGRREWSFGWRPRLRRRPTKQPTTGTQPEQSTG